VGLFFRDDDGKSLTMSAEQCSGRRLMGSENLVVGKGSGVSSEQDGGRNNQPK